MKACLLLWKDNPYRADFYFLPFAMVERRILVEQTSVFCYCHTGKAKCYRTNFCFSPSMVERRIIIEQTSIFQRHSAKAKYNPADLCFLPTTVMWKGAPAAIFVIQ